MRMMSNDAINAHFGYTLRQLDCIRLWRHILYCPPLCKMKIINSAPALSFTQNCPIGISNPAWFPVAASVLLQTVPPALETHGWQMHLYHSIIDNTVFSMPCSSTMHG